MFGDACERRRLASAENEVEESMLSPHADLAPSQEGATQEPQGDLASSQGNFARLSERNKAKMLGQPIPEVQGVNHKRSAAYLARQDARTAAYRYRRAEETEVARRERTGVGISPETRQELNELYFKAEDLWKYASKLSDDAGFDYIDMWGRKVTGKQVTIVHEVVERYMSEFGKHHFAML